MNDTILKIHVIPRSSKNEIIGWRNDILCIKITAPPVDGAANSAIIKFLADALKIRRSQLELVSGEKSREKSIRIAGLTGSEVRSILK